MNRTAALTLLLFGAIAVAYWPAIHGGFIWDDDDYVTHNAALEDAEGLRDIWLRPGTTRQYYPLVFTTFWIEARLWGLRPLGFHVVNVVLHAASAWLLWRLLIRLGLSGAWVAAAIFALHPVHVESVAWITERKNVLSAALYLGSALAYLRFDRLRERAGSDTAIRGSYAAALLLFVASLLSKTVSASLPAALLLVFWWKGRAFGRRTLLPLLPMFLLALPLGGLTIWMERYSVGARGADWGFSAIERCLIAGRALWFYAGKLAWPCELTFIYPRWVIDAGSAWQYLFPLAALAVFGICWALRHRTGRGPLVAVCFFAGTLVPALGFFDVYPMKYSFVADHFQYVASIGLIALGVGAVARGLRALPFLPRGAPHVLSIVVLLALAWLTWQQGRIYEDRMTLWRDTVDKNPTSWMARVSLGNELERTGRSDEAQEQYREAARHAPDNVMAHNNLGVMLFNQGRYDEAAVHFEAAGRLAPDDPMVQANLGDIRRVERRLDEALGHYRRAVEIKPDHAPTHYWMGMIHAWRGEAGPALEHLETALRLDPELTGAREMIARIRGR